MLQQLAAGFWVGKRTNDENTRKRRENDENTRNREQLLETKIRIIKATDKLRL